MNPENPRIAILGAGGVGGYFGGRWAEDGLEVSLLARGEHLAAIRRDGLVIRSPAGDATVRLDATDDAQRIGPVDLVVVATKTWQLEGVLEHLPPLVGPTTWVVGLQNGVEAAEVLEQAPGSPAPERVLGGTCRVISYIAGPGVIEHLGVEPTILMGKRPAGADPRVEALAARLSQARGVTVAASDDIVGDLWRKFLFFASSSGVGSVTQAPIGVVRSVPEVRQFFVGAMEEIFALARAKGIALADDSVETALSFFDGLPPDGTSSMQRDFRDGRRTELEALSGAVVRMGQAEGVPTPVNAQIYASLLPRELRVQGAIDWPGK